MPKMGEDKQGWDVLLLCAWNCRSIRKFPYCYFLFGLYIRRSVECVFCWYKILCRMLLPLRTHASMCCFKIWYFFIPNIVCIKGEEYDELKGALGNKIRLKSWWITFNHTDDDDEMKAVRKKGVRGNIACIFLDRLYKWMSYLVHLRCYWHKNVRNIT